MREKIRIMDIRKNGREQNPKKKKNYATIVSRDAV